MLSFESTSQLACHVGNLPLPTGEISESDQTCALTGVRILAGNNNLVRWKAGAPFRDQYDIVDRRSRFVTRETSAILKRPFMQKYSKSVISTDGWFSFNSQNDVAWHLLHPPTPPFAMVFGVAQMQHLLWRTPLSLSRELFFVRFTTKTLRIRHSRVLEALEISNNCLSAMNEMSVDDKSLKPLNSVFLPFSREINQQSNGRVHPRLYDAAETGLECAIKLLRFLPTLTTGDIWALGRILAARNKELTQPEPLTIELPTK